MAEKKPPDAISTISIEGFKSFLEQERIEIRPLTLLAGANSSGKSSALQPLLLLKQTLEASYDPGPLLLEGSHVNFTSAKQILSRHLGGYSASEFSIEVHFRERPGFREVFRRTADGGFDLAEMRHYLRRPDANWIDLQLGLSSEVLKERLPLLRTIEEDLKAEVTWKVNRNRCFLAIAPEESGFPPLPSTDAFARAIRSIIHVPGLRGNLQRTYKTAAIEDFFEGEFTQYVASVVMAWLQSGDDRLDQLSRSLEALGLTGTIMANPVGATRLELLVGRVPGQYERGDLVNIVDVGFGVSQVLPVLVALLVAKPGQLVYLEQPELHLHPYAQQALIEVLAEAAKRRVQVVVETHSSILLRAVQALIAEGKLSKSEVKLHWFKRDFRGATKIKTAKLDELGAYGDWPEDFGEVEAAVDNRYLDAVELKISPRTKHAKK
jgi:putative AbiEii toxin of type IV toxin-antitoxin system